MKQPQRPICERNVEWCRSYQMLNGLLHVRQINFPYYCPKITFNGNKTKNTIVFCFLHRPNQIYRSTAEHETIKTYTKDGAAEMRTLLLPLIQISRLLHSELLFSINSRLLQPSPNSMCVLMYTHYTCVRILRNLLVTQRGKHVEIPQTFVQISKLRRVQSLDIIILFT